MNATQFEEYIKSKRGLAIEQCIDPAEVEALVTPTPFHISITLPRYMVAGMKALEDLLPGKIGPLMEELLIDFFTSPSAESFTYFAVDASQDEKAGG